SLEFVGRAPAVGHRQEERNSASRLRKSTPPGRLTLARCSSAGLSGPAPSDPDDYFFNYRWTHSDCDWRRSRRSAALRHCSDHHRRSDSLLVADAYSDACHLLAAERIERIEACGPKSCTPAIGHVSIPRLVTPDRFEAAIAQDARSAGRPHVSTNFSYV